MFIRIARSSPRSMRMALATRAFSSKSIIPVIDIGQPREQVAAELARACTDIGFLSIVNHGVPQDVMDNMWKETHDFFDLPVAEKKAIAMTEDYPYGYSGFAEENLARGLDGGVGKLFGT